MGGKKEFQFIQRCGAEMGLVLGIGQMGLYHLMDGVSWMPWVFTNIGLDHWQLYQLARDQVDF